MRSPVLFLVFNRPETTRRVFEAIREARPPRLYVAADGPRPARRSEVQRCQEVRSIATAVDWPCEVHTLFRDENLGCKVGVSGGIDWFFDHESEGIILEDDVLPVSTFFDYCDELLELYRNDSRVAMVTGCNLISDRFRSSNSYFFSHYNHIWGWASWRRSWRNYDVSMKQWPAWRDDRGLAQVAGGNRLFQAYWRPIFDAVYDGKIDTWDYQWTYACWLTGGLTAMPSVNQTWNLGFGSDATHTTSAAPEFVRDSIIKPLLFPLIHPSLVERERRADNLIDANIFGITYAKTLKRRLRSIPGLANIAASIRAVLKNGGRLIQISAALVVGQFHLCGRGICWT